MQEVRERGKDMQKTIRLVYPKDLAWLRNWLQGIALRNERVEEKKKSAGVPQNERRYL